MSKGDNLIGKKTTYKGIEMRSRLETKIAFFLDTLNIKWEYEAQAFMLSDGTVYIPDFYLTELKLWIEVKGIVQEHNKTISRLFVQENNTELILISSYETFWFSMKDFQDGLGEDNVVYLGHCSSCKSYFFTSNIGSYYCRKCGTHNGDHDLIAPLTKVKNWNDWIIDDFSDINSIKRGLENYGISLSEF